MVEVELVIQGVMLHALLMELFQLLIQLHQQEEVAEVVPLVRTLY